MKVIFAITLLIAAALAGSSQQEFTKWLQMNSKSYSHGEYQYRYRVWRQNAEYIAKHNSNETRTFTVAMNQFGDLTGTEFRDMYLGYRMDLSKQNKGTVEFNKTTALPTSWDWRTKGAVTAIKNQEQCGSCWSFSTTGSTEGANFLKNNKLVSLSEQNLVDCSTAQGNQGCNGGLMTQAMDYIISNNGIDTEASYPYTAEDGTCSFNKANVGGTLKSYKNVPTGDETSLQNFVAQGPVSVAIDASQNSFQFYSSGVYNEPACSSTQLDHGVLAIGWGVDSGTAYWIVKNSWGTSWGQSGYIWMSRNANNQCGIATAATLPSA